MSRIAYVNGRYVLLRNARVSIEDRGYMFADGVYEVCALRRGLYLDLDAHLARLKRSLDAIRIAPPMSERALGHVIRETVRRNGLSDGLIYIQITRGAARRDHAFPQPPVPPTLVVTARPISWEAIARKAQQGIRVITLPDLRWKRPDIKTTGLLPNVLAREEARAQGANEAWFVGDDGMVTEGAASNAWIVTEAGDVVTHALDRSILGGVTRATLVRALNARQARLVERSFSVEEALRAREAFITSATNLVMPVVTLNGITIGSGKPGPMTQALAETYAAAVHATP